MAYKSLLTIKTDEVLSKIPLACAISLARREDAHLDVVCLGIDRTQTGYYYGGANAMIQQETLDRARQDADALEEATREQLQGLDISWGCSSGIAQLAGLTRIVAHEARFSDLVILPKPYGEGHMQELETIIEAVLFEAHSPVLVIPDDWEEDKPPEKVVIGWNQSPEALATIRAALPILKAAKVVNIAIIDPPQHGPERSDPGGALSQMLARHGVPVEVSVLAKTMPRVADVVTRHIRDVDADLLVMGAYGHSRFREAIIGGATRDMLERAEIPIFMAH